ncbi:hypothetical protein ACVWWK_003011 [Bradyrhizobium sp. LB9.1b]
MMLRLARWRQAIDRQMSSRSRANRVSVRCAAWTVFTGLQPSIPATTYSAAGIEMNALCRTFDAASVEDFDPSIADLLRGMQRDRRWSPFPYGWWTEADGSHVIFDRGYRLICRKQPNGAVEILPFARTGNFSGKVDDLWIDWVDQRWLYTGLTHPARDDLSRLRVLGVVQRLGVRDEIVRRREAADREWSQRRRYLRRRVA